MKVSGKMTSDMAGAMKGSRMGTSIRGSSSRARLMERVYSPGHTGRYTMESGSKG